MTEQAGAGWAGAVQIKFDVETSPYVVIQQHPNKINIFISHPNWNKDIRKISLALKENR